MLASAAMVRAGAPDLPYDLVETGKVVETGTKTYQGCDAWRETAVSDLWARPDGSQFVEAKGAGTPIGPGYACSSVGGKIAADWLLQETGSYCAQSTTPTCMVMIGDECWQMSPSQCVAYDTYGKYLGTNRLVRTDGITVQTRSSTQTSYPCNKVSGSCAANPTQDNAGSWGNAAGW